MPSQAVLVVDDDPVSQALAVALVEAIGFTDVRTAASGVEALAACSHQAFDLILMDCVMPGMDGLEATRQLRALGFTMPIVALTASSDAQHVRRCIEAGMSDHLSKPLDFAAMAATLLRWAAR